MLRGSRSTIFIEVTARLTTEGLMTFRFRRFVIALLLASAAASLAGCASGSSGGQAARWITETEAEKKRLNDAGFPQYSAPS
jgi:hypothetical protein